MMALTLEWTPLDGNSRKLVFEYHPEGDFPWVRIEYEHRDDDWHIVGSESLETLTLSGSDKRHLMEVMADE